MSERLAIVGAGGFGRETYDLVYSSDPRAEHWNIVGFVDPAADEQILERMGSMWLGGDDDFLAAPRADAVLLAISDPHLRATIAAKYQGAGIPIAQFVHPSVELGSCTLIGEGCIISAGVMLMNKAKLGAYVHLDRRTMVGHDSSIDDFATLHPGVCISGNVTVESFARLGTCSCVLPGVVVGSASVVGAGAVVTSIISQGVTVVGVPAKEIEKK